jgi:transcriptional regulator with XRE-family HTH domain
MTQPRQYTPEQRAQIQRFIKALNHYMVASHATQRDLAERLGVSVGTITKYLGGSVPPLNVCLEIQYELALALGVTLDALYHYYRSGEYVTQVTIEEVSSWIRSDAGQDCLPVLMNCLAEASQRWTLQVSPPAAPEAPQIWEWPLKELESMELTSRMRDMLTLTPARVQALVERGDFDDDLVNGFALACNYQVDAVRESFEARKPIE